MNDDLPDEVKQEFERQAEALKYRCPDCGKTEGWPHDGCSRAGFVVRPPVESRRADFTIPGKRS